MAKDSDKKKLRHTIGKNKEEKSGKTNGPLNISHRTRGIVSPKNEHPRLRNAIVSIKKPI